MKLVSRLKTCKWCYGIFLLEESDKHSSCRASKKLFLYRQKASINYDKTGGQTNDRTIK